MKKILSLFLGVATLLSPLAFPASALAVAPQWDVTGDYTVAIEYQGTDYPHDISLAQDAAGNLTGNGTSVAGGNTYTWVITSGEVDGDDISFTADYTATQDAVTPQAVMEVEGTIAQDGTLSGTWSDNYDGGNRWGDWTSTTGEASEMTMTPAVADVDNDGYVSGAEGVPFYGAVVNSFTTSGDTTEDSALALGRFPVANANGDYLYTRTFTLADEITDLEDVAIVVHGADINENGVYDGAKRSTLDPALPFEGTVPVACGVPYKTQTNTYKAQLNQLNSTGVTGDVTIQKMGNQVMVTMKVEDASPNLAHAQHFHLGGTNECPPNTIGVMQETGTGSSTGDIEGDVVGDEVMLEVTSIEMTDTSATANGSFEGGWEYVFHITAPMDEQDLSMKFDNWLRTGGNGTIPVANNMRISSSQANNGGATILLTAENTYSTPALYMTGDLDANMDGRQVKITVEVAVPNGTPNGSYTTSYGVQSL